MIVCHDYKFVLVQVPHTASTDFGNLLAEKYGGVSILSKHSYLDELRFFYPKLYSDYFLVGGVRNPLEERISSYHKLVSNHVGLYDGSPLSAEYRRARGIGQLRRRSIITAKLSFSDYVIKSVRLVYFSPIYIKRERFDYVYSIESLESDWAKISSKIGAPYLPITKRNVTDGVPNDRSTELINIYSESAQRHSTKIFGKFMVDFGYSFPDAWCHGRLPSKLEMGVSFAFRRAMWASWAVQNSMRYLK